VFNLTAAAAAAPGGTAPTLEMWRQHIIYQQPNSLSRPQLVQTTPNQGQIIRTALAPFHYVPQAADHSKSEWILQNWNEK
jgi:hypothetical protein